MTSLTAGAPLEPPHHAVGRRTIGFVDHDRGGRLLTAEVWYPAPASRQPRAIYEVLPGVAFTAATAQQEPGALAGPFPLVLFSHGRTGTRISYAMLAEALAARGAIVVSADHPGDALVDWLTGTHSDDRTNEVDRVGDAHFLLRSMLHGEAEVPVDLANAIDHRRIVLAGHSYGAYTAFATAAGSRGVPAHERVGAIIGFQAFTRTMSDSLLGRITVPVLLVVSEDDRVTPPEVDADRPWALLHGHPTWRLDLAGAGHQAVSDIALYAELADRVPGLPAIVRDYLTSTSAGAAAAHGRSWRELLQLQVTAAWAFLGAVFGDEPQVAVAAADALGALPGLTLRRR